MRHQQFFANGPVRIAMCRHGPMMYLEGDEIIGMSLKTYGEFAEAELALIKQFLFPGAHALDLGANIGVHSVFLGQAVGPNGRVISCEPQRGIHQILCSNLCLNNLLNVEAERCAVGEEASSLLVPRWRFDNLLNYGSQRLYNYVGDGDPTPVVTVDSWNLAQCDFIKMDIEGMELMALRGALDTIRRHRPVMFIENNVRETSGPMLEFILSQGYQVFWHLPSFFNKENFSGNPENVVEGLIESNILCLPREKNINISRPPVSEHFIEVMSADYWPSEHVE